MGAPSVPAPQPLVPENYIDAPTQRLYFLSLGLLCQAIKAFDFLQCLFMGDGASSNSYIRKWLIADFTYILALARLRIPRLNYSKSVIALQLLLLCFVDGVLFGGITLNVSEARHYSDPAMSLTSGRLDLPSTPPPLTLADVLSRVGFGMLVSSSSSDSHLSGQHTVVMSPTATAQLNPEDERFCLASPGSTVLIPVLLNNTNPTGLRYSLAPLGYSEDSEAMKVAGKIEYLDLNARDLKAIENARMESLAVVRQTSTAQRTSDDDYDDDDDDDDEGGREGNDAQSSLQKSQSLTYIRVSKPGVLRLERVVHSSSVDARVIYPSSVTIAPCPRASFVDDPVLTRGDSIRCAGDDPDLNLAIDIYGVPPLSLRWYKVLNDRTESFVVEGIEAGHHGHSHDLDTHAPEGHKDGAHRGQIEKGFPQQLKVPLTVTVDAIGAHSYVLDWVSDGLGNMVRLEGGSPSTAGSARKVPPSQSHGTIGTGSNTKVSRSLRVLQRPSVSFRRCAPGRPASLLIGSESSLAITAKDADPLDGPWEVAVKYQPPSTDETGTGVKALLTGKKLKPWTKTLTLVNEKRDLTLMAGAPGEYTIQGVKGKYCQGDVLSPETCKVVEMPHPSADIEWKRIHECSGDTGVSAAIVLHGTPPFQVWYRSQKDNEGPKDHYQHFSSSRGEITIQPEHSGHYTYTFAALSDANYKKIKLDGPSIDQLVHPLASVDFAHAGAQGRGSGKKKISSCAGNIVDVDVELKGTGPWSIEVQVVGPKSTDTIIVPGIPSGKKTLQIPIPKDIDAEGGTFGIDLVSVEDAYGCKRAVSVPGVSVDVRRIKPTVKFYSKDGQRHVTILEETKATLPLRLTGDGPWRLKYRRLEAPERVSTASLSSPNDKLQVSEKGTYEIVAVVDSQCPGSVVADESTYQVDWVPRPSARFSSDTEVAFDEYSGRYTLPPVCEGRDDHVDLELTGRPPFQLMYNIARDRGTSGTELLDQPTFSSIQPTTRFQLYTSEAGRKYYEVKQLGDAAYPLAKHAHGVIPRADRLLFTQDVLPRPSAQFKRAARLAYCLGDAFTPRAAASSSTGADAVVELEGTPPFQLQLSVKNLAAGETHHATVAVRERTWRVDLPAYVFRSVGPHRVAIESVQDAARCEQAVPDPHTQMVWVDVAESAAIVPFDRREHFCVGDVSQFQLEGTPPWTVGYRINGKAHTQEAKTSPFSLVQQQPGEFAVTSIAHQQRMCKAAVTDLRYTVHALPSAQVGHGRRIVQDLHEGDQAEIVFTLIGAPPFTFTYQRAEPAPKKGGRPGKVLETHTVSGVTGPEYSVYSALEGTWTVTFISDKYCRYPPVQPSGGDDRSRR